MRRAALSLFLLLAGIAGAETAFAGNPLLTEPEFARNPIRLGEVVSVSVEAQADDGGELSFIWSAVVGKIEGSGATVRYLAPDAAPANNLDTVTVSARDSRGRVTTHAGVIHFNTTPAPGHLFFEPGTAAAWLGEPARLGVFADPGGELAERVDLEISFDEKKLRVDSVEFLLEGKAAGGDDFSSGKISFSGRAGKPFTSRKKVAEIFFTPRELGLAELEFDFAAGDLEDSNLFAPHDERVDLLAGAASASIEVLDPTAPLAVKKEEESTIVLKPAEEATPAATTAVPNSSSKVQLLANEEKRSPAPFEIKEAPPVALAEVPSSPRMAPIARPVSPPEEQPGVGGSWWLALLLAGGGAAGIGLWRWRGLAASS